MDGVEDDLAHTVGGGIQRIPQFVGHMGNARGPGHFNDGSLAFINDAVGTVYRCAERTGHLNMLYFPAHTAGKGLYSSLTAVSQGADTDLRVGIDPLYAHGNGLTAFQRGETAFH